MKKRNKNILWILFFIVIIVFIVVAINFQAFESSIREYVEIYGYPAVFVLVFITELINQPIGPEVPASFGVLLSMNFLLIFILASIASLAAGIINYNIGSRFLSKRIMMSCDTEKYMNYCRKFYKYGKISVFLAAISPLPYVFFVWLTGAFNIEFNSFLIFGMIPRLARIFVIMLSIALVV